MRDPKSGLVVEGYRGVASGGSKGVAHLVAWARCNFSIATANTLTAHDFPFTNLFE